jgi:hypothetical protein
MKLIKKYLKTTTHSGKLEGIPSLATSFASNCFDRQKIKNSICEKCYQIKYEKFRPSLKKALEFNTSKLSKIIPYEEIPTYNYSFFRFNSFGELHNNAHFFNLVNIAQKNPHCNFTLYTKEFRIVSEVLNAIDKPKNLILIFSSPMVNTRAKLPKFFDKVFTVYGKTEKTKINCNKKCIDCKLCYTKNKTIYINERIK